MVFYDRLKSILKWGCRIRLDFSRFAFYYVFVKANMVIHRNLYLFATEQTVCIAFLKLAVGSNCIKCFGASTHFLIQCLS